MYMRTILCLIHMTYIYIYYNISTISSKFLLYYIVTIKRVRFSFAIKSNTMPCVCFYGYINSLQFSVYMLTLDGYIFLFTDISMVRFKNIFMNMDNTRLTEGIFL